MFIIFSNVALESHFHYLYTVTAPKSWVVGKINQLGYVTPHLSSKAFLVTGCFEQAGNVWILRNFHHLTKVALESHFHYLYTVTAPKSWAGDKVNRLGYVAPHLKLDEFQKMGFCNLPSSIFLW